MTTYATEIIERGRAATAARVFPWSAPFEELAVGRAFTTHEHVVTASDVAAFATLTGDHHPIHTDAAWAAASPFGERIAHGLLVVSLAAGLVPFDPRRVVALRRVVDATFKRAVRFNDVLRVEGKIDSLRPVSDEAGLVTFVWNVVNQDRRVVCRAKVEVLWKRDDAFTAIPL
jgi:acyl dehydratase